MTPLISTRFAALSPRPDNASIAGSRSAPTEYSLCPSLFGPLLDGGPPSFLDSKPSDPMTPDPTQNTRPSMPIHDAATRIFRVQDNTLGCHAHIKNKIVANYKQPCVVANQLDQFPTNGPRVSPISYRITRSAISSCSVGSLLIITSLAPQFLASIGNPAAGQTTSEDPIAINRSHCCASSVARRIASSGIA